MYSTAHASQGEPGPPRSVSVVIPHFDRPVLLLRAIDSCLRQGDGVREIIVVDDGSSLRPPPDAIARYESTGKVAFAWGDTNRGSAYALNLGIAMAKSPYVALLDSDDEWLPGKIERQLVYMHGRSLDLCATWFDVVEEGTRVVPVDFPPFDGDTPAFVLVAGGHMQTSTLILGPACVATVRFDEGLKKFQDWNFVIRAHTLGLRIGVLDEVLSLYHHQHGGPQIADQIRPAIAENLIRVHRAVVSRRLAHVFMMRRVTRMHLQAKDWRGAIRCAMNAIVRYRYLSPYETARFVRRLLLHAIDELRRPKSR